MVIRSIKEQQELIRWARKNHEFDDYISKILTNKLPDKLCSIISLYVYPSIELKHRVGRIHWFMRLSVGMDL